MIIQNELGEDVEVFTAEEKQAAIEEYKIQNPDKTEEITKLQTDLTKATEELAKFENKDLNFGNLRAAKEDAEKKAEGALKAVDEKIAAATKNILEGVLVDHKNDGLKALAGDDVELQKKIEFHYNRLSDPASTKAEVTKKLTDAWVLATGKPSEESSVLDSTVVSSGSVSKLNIKNNTPFSDEEKELARKLAAAGNLGELKDEDFK